jgi:hypothetical protein
VNSRVAATSFTGGQGNDTLIIVGTSGNDTFEVDQTQTVVGGRTVTYDASLDNLTLQGRNGADVFLISAVTELPIDVDGGGSDDYLALDNNGLNVVEGNGTLGGDGVDIGFAGAEQISNCDFGAFAADDCNENGVPDGCEVDSGVAGDGDSDGLLDDCEQSNGNDNGNTNGNDNDNDNGNTNGNDNDNGNANGNDNDGNDNDDDNGNGNGNGNDNDNDDGGDDEPNSPLDCFAMLCGMGVVPMMPFIVAGLCGLKFSRRIRRI